MKKNPTKFNPNPIWIDGALSFFEVGRPNKKKNKMISDMGSVPDLAVLTKKLGLQINRN